MTKNSFRYFAWGLLGYNILVVLWGAFVRASKSGDGCGSHWPTCQGEAFHLPQSFATLVEYTHRLSSGLVLLLVIALVIWAFRAFPRGNVVRRTALLSLFFTLTEALIGAGLVLFGLVADNDSNQRAIVLSAHLLNTFLLLGSVTLTAWWSGKEEAPENLLSQWRGQGIIGWFFALALVSTLLVGISGSIAALGDTLFPARSLQEALQQDLSPTAHILIRLRVLHPFLAIGTGLYLVYLARLAARQRFSPEVQTFARMTIMLFCIQIACGFLNVRLLAPVWMQIVHLFLADVLWINLVLLTVSALAVRVLPVEAARRVETDEAAQLPAGAVG